MLRMKRAYEEPAEEDGVRVLVERLWPRGLTKEKAGIDIWCREVAPSAGLRKWYAHDPEKWEEFRQRYLEELKGSPHLDALRRLSAGKDVTLIFSTHDAEHSGAAVLMDLLTARPELFST
jgi:uncharacterized protein YeaO (DUF488 family)